MSATTEFHHIANDALVKISEHLRPGAKLCLVIYTPGEPDKDIVLRDGWLSDDEVLSTLRRRGLSIDGDNAYKRDLMDTITGAMAFGFQNVNPPPEEHWGKRFWEIGRAEGAERERLINQRDAILLQARVWAGEAKTQRAITREIGEILGGIPSWGPIAAGVEALHQRVAAIELMREHRIAVTPEHEGQWHADLYGDESEYLARAEADTPEAAVHAVLAAHRAQQGGE